MQGDCRDRYARGNLTRKAINASRDRRECDLAKAASACDRKRRTVTVLEDPLFPGIPATPDRADGMNDMPGGQTVTAGQARLTRRAATKLSAFCEKLGPSSPVDRAVDPTAAEQ